MEYVQEKRNGVRKGAEERIAKSVEAKVRKDFQNNELVDDYSMSIWIIVLTSVCSVLLTLFVVFSIYFCRDHSKVDHWDAEGLGNYIAELKTKSATKLSGVKPPVKGKESENL